ncbi:MAG: DUF2071 domain-containing protein [Acidobacteria bacterium]|nr:DUF2071 domain-containing protein [Acidobacteriota bacterium]MCA1651202.1 DUF2071 domain-containing protein [Acidobacteriota bacterium]
MPTRPQNDFNYTILSVTAHRPWPMPASPWIMTQTWHDLLFAHWPVAVEALRELVPAAFEIEMFDGEAWLGVVPFDMTNVAPRGVPALPWLSAFPELNVRTYVRVGGKPGVYFFSLDAANPVAVGVARTLVHLPYYSATMSVTERDGFIEYRSRRTSSHAALAEFTARYRPTGPAGQPAAGTLEHFLTERYCLYTVDKSARAYRLDIHHAPWPVQRAEAEITRNSMAEAAGIHLPARPPVLHFSRRQDMVAWPLRAIADQ